MLLLGVDIGTSGSKGVLTTPDGTVVATATREHGVSSPRPGWAEHDARAVWWSDFTAIARELGGAEVAAGGVGGIGPRALPAAAGRGPLPPADPGRRGPPHAPAAAETGLAEGTPVIAGTIDAWAEAVSVGVTEPGDVMVMYGTTMFLIEVLAARGTWPTLWGTVGVEPGTYNLAAGMATSGA